MEEDTGLNILAIGIFTITLTVLLGPIFHISPFIPATITFVALGLITVDTLSWQSQGVNLFINLFASKEQKERIIYHEAGHFLLAHLYEIPIVSYTLTPWEAFKVNININNPACGGVVFDTGFLKDRPQDLKDLNSTMEHFGVVLMAGIAAEKTIYEHSRGGEEDKQIFRSIYGDVGFNPTQYDTKQRSSILQAKTIIEENKESYLALVEAMRERQSVHECKEKISNYKMDSFISN